jgi:aryl-alcohol dehydrogenase-like predicted oxidoreductase
MIKRAFGSTDMVISVIGLGSWAIGGWMWGGQDDADSEASIHAAVEAGVNWIDTAPIYGGGASEEVVGRTVAAMPEADRPLLFSKFGLGTGPELDKKADAAAVRAECDNSLRRLQVERIDLYQLHWPTDDPIDETAQACDELLRAGKIRAVGVCNYSLEQMQAWQATGLPLHSLQTPFNLFRQASAEHLIPYCAEQNLGCLAYSPLFRGMLFGQWTADKTFPEGDTRREHPDYQGERFRINLHAVDRIAEVADEHDMLCAELCVGCLLSHEGLTAAIVGARNREQGAFLGELGTPPKRDAVKAVKGILWDRDQELAALEE